MTTVLDIESFIEALLTVPRFRRELEEGELRKRETFTLRLLVWDGETEELHEANVRGRTSSDCSGG